jgi:hypothetical protein
MIAGYHHKVGNNCNVMDNYAVSSGNFLPTFQDNLSVPQVAA